MRIVLSCYVDRDAVFLRQAWHLLLSLHAQGAAPGGDLRFALHHPPGLAGQLAPHQALGAELVETAPFGEGPARYCNKLTQLASPALEGADYAVLLDADMLACADPRRLIRGKAIRAKLVDVENPPAAELERLLSEANLTARSGWRAPDFAPEGRTMASNCNGGLYLLPGAALRDLREPWPRWSRFVLARAARLGARAIHADQIGFAFALEETGLALDPLAVHDNFPGHFPTPYYAATPEAPLTMLHYHRNVDDQGLPRPVGVDWIDAQIARATQAIRPLRAAQPYDLTGVPLPKAG